MKCMICFYLCAKFVFVSTCLKLKTDIVIIFSLFCNHYFAFQQTVKSFRFSNNQIYLSLILNFTTKKYDVNQIFDGEFMC